MVETADSRSPALLLRSASETKAKIAGGATRFMTNLVSGYTILSLMTDSSFLLVFGMLAVPSDSTDFVGIG